MSILHHTYSLPLLTVHSQFVISFTGNSRWDYGTVSDSCFHLSFCLDATNRKQPMLVHGDNVKSFHSIKNNHSVLQ